MYLWYMYEIPVIIGGICEIINANKHMTRIGVIKPSTSFDDITRDTIAILGVLTGKTLLVFYKKSRKLFFFSGNYEYCKTLYGVVKSYTMMATHPNLLLPKVLV